MQALTFLVADDNDLQRRVAETYLWRAGHQVMFAASADEVVAALAAHDASVVLISAGLPGDEAFAALTAARRPRRDPETFAVLPPPPIVIGASPKQRALADRLLERGAAGIIERPYLADRLVAQLELFSVGAAPSTILVIDDSRTARGVAVMVLCEEGHTVIEAADGRQGLAALRRHPEVDLVISDVIMPEVDGFGVCQAIRSMAPNPSHSSHDAAAKEAQRDLPIILLTSLDDIASQSRAVEVGADEFLTKPTSPTELKLRVRTILRLKSLQRRLAQRNQELEQALELRERLSRMLVHDFRNPLARIVVAADMVLADCKDAGLGEASELAEEIIGGAGQLSGLADDLLRVARLEDGVERPELAEVAVAEIIGEVAGDLRRLADDKTVRLRTNVPANLRVSADPRWLYRVLQNLCDNAIGYSPAGGEVAISAFARRDGDRPMVAVRVVDDGPGIPAEHREMIFREFGQLNRGHRRGTGLGLTFCRLAIEAHGGAIAATERPDGAPGGAFLFTLPAVVE